MKYEWRKQEKNLYDIGKTPAALEVKEQAFITISGQGNPNDMDFSNRVSALYALAYAIKMAYKQMMKSQEESAITDFTVYPLEGIWQQAENTSQHQLEKDKLSYTIMIRQPDFITERLVVKSLETLKIKKPNPLYDEISFEKMADGRCVQILHIGSYDDEPNSFAKMDTFTQREGLKRLSKSHREIYLSNAQRTAKDRLKTILRYQVEEENA